jgi:UDP-N-acetylmuramyl pentapeptide phosphotransferase/UDP-N-acetylglucosamine-1-phosphate transferase
MIYLTALITALVISMIIIPLMIRVAPLMGMIDHPDPRKVHARPIPRVGGWGIVLGALVPILMWVPMDKLTASYLLGSLVLLVFGAWDDAHPLGHYVKFVGQFIAALAAVLYGDLCVYYLPFLGLDPVPGAFGIPFTVVALVGMINATNHSDGLDGLAGGVSLLSLCAIAFLAHMADGQWVVLIAMGAIGGILGFLRYNTHPAYVFMGDGGSQFLGFTLGILTIQLTQKVNPALSPAVAALLLGLPVIDILVVLTQRIYHGLNWFKATKNHIHHRLLKLGFIHEESVVIIYSVQAVFVLSAVLLCYESDLLILALYAGICTMLFLLLTIAERTNWKVHQPGEISYVQGLVKRVKDSGTMIYGANRFIALAVPAYLVGLSFFVSEVPRDFGLAAASLFVILVLAMLFRGEKGPIIWSHGVIYVTAAFIVYLGINHPPEDLTWLGPIDFSYFFILALAICLVIRYASDIEFRMTTMDYLVVCLVLGVGLLSESQFHEHRVGVLVVKGVIIFYGCELLINRTDKRWNFLNAASLTTLGVLGVRGLAT